VSRESLAPLLGALVPSLHALEAQDLAACGNALLVLTIPTSSASSSSASSSSSSSSRVDAELLAAWPQLFEAASLQHLQEREDRAKGGSSNRKGSISSSSSGSSSSSSSGRLTLEALASLAHVTVTALSPRPPSAQWRAALVHRLRVLLGLGQVW